MCTGSINCRKALSAAKTKTLFSVASVFGKQKSVARGNGRSSDRTPQPTQHLNAVYMPGRGLEPLRISPPDPKSGASANFATLAWGNVFLSAQILAQSGNSADRSRGQELSRVRLKNFYRNTKPFRRTGALPESAHLNYRFFHQPFVHPGDAKPNNRIREECRLHRFGHAAAKFRHIENMPDFQSNMRQPAEISITMKRHLRDTLLRTDYPNELIRERIIEQPARMPCEQSPFRIIARVRKCLQKSSQRFLVH